MLKRRSALRRERREAKWTQLPMCVSGHLGTAAEGAGVGLTPVNLNRFTCGACRWFEAQYNSQGFGGSRRGLGCLSSTWPATWLIALFSAVITYSSPTSIFNWDYSSSSVHRRGRKGAGQNVVHGIFMTKCTDKCFLANAQDGRALHFVT